MYSYLDMYRQRIFANGSTAKDRIEHNLAKDFLQLVKRSPNRVSIDYENMTYDCILASGNSRVGTQTERKVIQYLMTDRSLKLPEGALFKTHDLDISETQYWLILHREIHPYYGYYKYKVIELDYMIKYVDNSGVLKEIPVYVNGTGEFDIKEYFRYVNSVSTELPNRALNLILPANKDFVDGLRFIIGDEAWRYVDSDKISIPGVYYTTINKTTVDNSSDLVEEKIADANEIGSATILSNYGANSITIGLNVTNLKFFYFKNGKIKDGSMMFSNYDEEVIKFEAGKLIPIKEGKTELTVEDKISGFIKTFKITIQLSLNHYFYVTGNTKIATKDSCIWDVYTDQNFTIAYDNTMVKIDKTDSKIKITALNKIGNATIQFLASSGEELFKRKIEVTSLWV